MKKNRQGLKQVFCISGKARHGKDTSAEMLKNELEELGNSVLIIGYADLLKFYCEKYFGWDGEKDDRGRSILQHIGTDIIRNMDEDHWVDHIIRFIQNFRLMFDYIIIPDCRFPNELYKMRENNINTVLVRVYRSNFDNKLTEEQKRHISETAMDGIPPDYVIDNSGDLVSLRKKIDLLAKNTVEVYKD